jgi:hypothetical protein
VQRPVASSRRVRPQSSVRAVPIQTKRTFGADKVIFSCHCHCQGKPAVVALDLLCGRRRALFASRLSAMYRYSLGSLTWRRLSSQYLLHLCLIAGGIWLQLTMPTATAQLPVAGKRTLCWEDLWVPGSRLAPWVSCFSVSCSIIPFFVTPRCGDDRAVYCFLVHPDPSIAELSC